MSNLYPLLVLGSQAVFAACTGAFALARPARFAAGFGLNASHPSGENEVRSQYGGFFIAVAAVLAAAVAGRVPVLTGLIIVLMVFGGLLAGRLIGTAIDGGVARYTPLVKGLLAVEAVIVALALLALRTAV